MPLAAEQVRVQLVHLQGARVGPGDEQGLERLAEAVSAVTALPGVQAVLVGGELLGWPAESAADLQQLDLVLSVLSILAAPPHAVLAGADLGPAGVAAEVLRRLQERALLPGRQSSYHLPLVPGCRLVVLGEPGPGGAGAPPGGAAAVVREALAAGAEPVAIVAAHAEPADPGLRALLAASPRIKLLLCAEAHPEGRPAGYPPVLVTPALAERARFRVVALRQGRIHSYVLPVLGTGEPEERFEAPMR